MCLLLAATAQGTTTLLSNNSTVGLDLASSAGMNSWVVDGVNQVNQQWFWFRVGSSGPQSDLSQITTTPFVTINSSKQVTVLYTNSTATYGVQLQYTLAGQATGSGKSGLTENVRVFNYNPSAPLAFNLFMYSDFTLGGSAHAADQSVQLGNDGTSVQSVGSFAVGTNNFVVQTPANRLEAALFNQTLNELTTVNGYDLNNVAAAGPGHATWAMEWNMPINAGGSSSLSLLDNLQVPEPSALALALLGGLCSLLRRGLVRTQEA